MVSVSDVAKAVLKVGTKAAMPVLGDILSTAVEEAGGLLLDADTAKRALYFQDRLIRGHAQRPGTCMPQRGHVRRPADRRPRYSAGRAHPYSLTVAEWAETHFDRNDAAAKVLKRAHPLLSGLDEGEKRKSAASSRASMERSSASRDLLLDTEADFRSSVLHCLDQLLARTPPQSATDREDLIRGIEAAIIALPKRRWNELLPPGALLRAGYGVVPFHGRQREIDDLQAWCDEVAQVGIRLYTGAGGMGKSRLLIEQCERLLRQGWRAGFLERDADKADPGSGTCYSSGLAGCSWLSTTRRLSPRRLRRTAGQDTKDELPPASASRFCHVLQATGGMTFRAEGDGVGDLLMGPATRWHSVGPAALSADDRAASYRLAAERFAGMLQKPVSLEPPDNLAAPYFERILLLHMMALAAVEGIAVKGENGILEWMLARERRFWKSRARDRDLPGPVAEKLGEAMALFTLIQGASTQREALDYLAKLPSFKDQPKAIRDVAAMLLHECYPGTRWIEPVQPDLLGEELVGAEASEEIFALVFDPSHKSAARPAEA